MRSTINTGGDPKRGWTFDFSYDSKNEDEYMTLVHGCVEGELRDDCGYIAYQGCLV